MQQRGEMKEGKRGPTRAHVESRQRVPPPSASRPPSPRLVYTSLGSQSPQVVGQGSAWTLACNSGQRDRCQLHVRESWSLQLCGSFTARRGATCSFPSRARVAVLLLPSL